MLKNDKFATIVVSFSHRSQAASLTHQVQIFMALPSLRSLQIFEIAARHESFRAAADSLYLTHGAVSRQVRALESELGVELFSRVGKKVILTAQGKRLQIAVAKGLKVMEDATDSLCRKSGKSTTRLAITVVPSFGSRWLLPRLADFHARHPEISVDLLATQTTLNMEESKVQVGIRMGGGRWSGVKSELLARESLFPVIGKHGVTRACLRRHERCSSIRY
jgi:LysR family glycine cleavage system transcriptional activator